MTNRDTFRGFAAIAIWLAGAFALAIVFSSIYPKRTFDNGYDFVLSILCFAYLFALPALMRLMQR
ncbi:MAG: hypothetical protein WAU78_10105 [Roseiarcus sp.]|jgi:hypothetical protein